MSNDDTHPPDDHSHPSGQKLLLYADGELSSRNAGRIRTHLAACWECRAHMAEIEIAIASFMRAHRQSREVKSDIAGPRALLKARLAELRLSSGKDRWRHPGFVLGARGFLYVCAMVLLAALGIATLYRQTGSRVFSRPSDLSARSLPDPSLTPGSTRPMTFADLCSSDNDEVVEPVPGSLRQKVFQEYGIGSAPASDYEVDYLITPGLGGSGDIRNLWPEPHHSTVWNSYVKDQLENRLHHMVCAGTLSLGDAQKGIASNWISTYKKYFHTDRPILKASPSGASGTWISSWPVSRILLARPQRL